MLLYNAFFDNSMVDIAHLSAEDATPLEKQTNALYEERMKLINSRLKDQKNSFA